MEGSLDIAASTHGLPQMLASGTTSMQQLKESLEKDLLEVEKKKKLEEDKASKTLKNSHEKLSIGETTQERSNTKMLYGKTKEQKMIQDEDNSHQLVNANLTLKLEKTEIKLQETENSLLDLEERHRQANIMIKEKEFLIFNLLSTELENASSDVSNLFTKIDRKDKIEGRNRIV
ncbi:kinesin-like protein KIN-5D [Tanacetum coccineum]|uniref:Kinesin-like protein KIN-5D n=1 Tax=Tanacetum coccineum TaxID=301880 RepID=A0ABQ4WUR3_9ASTR